MTPSSPYPARGMRRTWNRCITVLAWIGYFFLLLPSLVIVPISFGGGQELRFPPDSFSLDLFRRFFAEPAWWQAAVKSLIVASATTVMALAVALPGAYALARTRFRGRRLLEVLAIAPMLVPVVVLGLGMYMHLSALALVDTLAGVALAHTVVVLPFMMVAVGSGLRQADPALETVATLMGAGPLRIFVEVVLPQIRPSVLVGVLFAFLISFDEVVLSYFITGPASTTLPVKMYSAIRWEVSPVLAAVSTLLTGLSLAVCLMIIRLQPPTPRAD
ncbi:ABC transporter permease [Bordetella sp. BOR01]|uniref:ABC transporter permease n=1 Tax=Bordetella sp. BOR01 TaxID=2854779 RepID=UPI001C48768D|nr:ABC transporter permease [Bordetella sp. BOR01]MBV7485313.1 ABC transporter permease [Bordetella sp. BOR01]